MTKFEQIDAISCVTARDLMAIYRELEGVRTASVATDAKRQMYIVQIREDPARKRVAVVEAVSRLPGDRVAMETTGGETIVICARQIEVWEPLLRRDAEPLPDGWWRKSVGEAKAG